MRKIFKVNPKTRNVYLSKDLEEEGYCSTGELEGYPNAFTVTLLRPGASLGQAVVSLRTVIQDLEARMEDQEGKQPEKPAGSVPTGKKESAQEKLDRIRAMLA